MRIVILDGSTLNPGDNPWTPLEALGQVVVHDRTPAESIVARSSGADVLVINKVRLTDEAIGALPELKFIAVTATGYDCVDVAAARRRGIAVSNVPVYGTDSVAQHVFSLLLHVCGNVAGHAAAVRAGRWTSCPDFCFWDTPLVELAGRTLGIVGFGRIGRRVGEIGHALGMSIVAFDQYHGDPPTYDPFAWADDLIELCRRSDVISLHCNLTAENAGLVNAEFLRHVRPGAVLINTSRGGLVNESDLADALNQGRLSAAAVDVVSREPIEADNPLLAARNCVITPHIAWATLSARRRLLATTAENIAAFQTGSPQNVVN
jgi:glycerate dehydrogenase